MARSGRRRKAGEREPNGRPQRPTVDRLNAMAKDARLAEQRTVLNQPHRMGEESPWAATALGRFCLRRKLRRELYQAGEDYAGIVSRWRACWGAPRETGTPQTGSGSGKGPTMLTAERWRQQMLAIERAVMRYGIESLLAVRTLAIDHGDIGMDQDEVAISGLMAVAVELGLTDGREKPFTSSRA